MLLDAIAAKEKTWGEYRLTPGDLRRVHYLMGERYLRRDWNFKSDGACDTRRSHRFAAGLVETRLRTAHGRIRGCSFHGDFFGYGDPADIENLLIGHRRDRNEIHELLDQLDLNHYFHGIGTEGILEMIV